MHTLIYLSSASYLFLPEDLTAILQKSQKNNKRLDITGLLLYNEGSIMQVLEGEEKVIKTLYTTIAADDRHRGVIKMVDGSIDERSFQNWSMGFKQLSSDDWKELQGILNLNDKNEMRRLASVRSSDVVALIKSFSFVNNLL